GPRPSRRVAPRQVRMPDQTISGTLVAIVPRFTAVSLLVIGLLGIARSAAAQTSANPAPPLRLALAGLVHGHASGFLETLKTHPDVQLVGIEEPDIALQANTPPASASTASCSSPT